MSAVRVRAALETALLAMSPSLSSAMENTAFEPVSGVPYQKVHILFGTPENTENTASYDEVGFMQIQLRYPEAVGSGSAASRLELIRSAFRRGATFASGGVTTTIMGTPGLVGPGFNEGDRFCLTVRIPFRAQIQL